MATDDTDDVREEISSTLIMAPSGMAARHPRTRAPWLIPRGDGTWMTDPEWHNPINDLLLDHPERLEAAGLPPLTPEVRARLEHARALHLERQRRKREQAEAEAGHGEG